MPLGRAPDVHHHVGRHLTHVAALDVHDVEVALVELPGLEVGGAEGEPGAVGRPRQRALRRLVVGQVTHLAGGDVEQRDLGEIAVVAPVFVAVGVGDALGPGRHRELGDAQVAGGEPARLGLLRILFILRVQRDRPDARPLAARLPVGCLVDEDGVVAVLAPLLLVIGERVVGHVEDRVGVAPLEGAHRGGVLGQRPRLPAVGADDEDLPRAVLAFAGRTQKRHPAAVRGPARTGVPVLPGEAAGIRAVRVHDPERRDALVLVPVQFGAREQHPLPVRGHARIRNAREVDGVVDAEGRLLRRRRAAPEGEDDGEERESGASMCTLLSLNDP